ncbi:MAG: hypothetical protein HYY37_06160 [Candidatus Aenigmarchaeota archaeon]|nr:hypothetical protein [Candidatus Aenigmarchaeota archaeon]
MVRIHDVREGASVLKTGPCGRDDGNTVGFVYNVTGVERDTDGYVRGFYIRTHDGLYAGHVSPRNFGRFTIM